MKLIVISPEAEDAREHAVLVDFFVAGLTSYHLRKPTWTRARMAAWLGVVPAEFHERIVLHTHHDLAKEFPVGGVHERDDGGAKSNPIGCFMRSRAVHELGALKTSLGEYDRVLFSPVFASISKPGHGPAFDAGELRAVLALPRRAEVIALGGVDASRIAVCRDLGFDGVAVLGAVWQASEPLLAFAELSRVAAAVTRLATSSATPSSLVTSATT